MIIVLKQDAPEVQVREFCHELQDMGLQINDSKGSEDASRIFDGKSLQQLASGLVAKPDTMSEAKLCHPRIPCRSYQR